jgi:ribosomal protein S18 acetylase RimI-like enzyme
MKTELIPLITELLPDAGKLLAQRHQHNRRVLPELPVRFEDADVATKAIEALWDKKTARGFAALRHGKLVAYLIGETMTHTWGRSGYVYLPGYASAQGESPALIQDLYALLGDEWVKKGCFIHSLYISAADAPVINALFDLGFGKERVDALMDLRKAAIPEVEDPAGITIRQAGKGDNEYLGSLSDVIFRALAEAPYWHPTVPEDWEELREGWSELADDKEWTVWLALDADQRSSPVNQRSSPVDQALGTVGFRPEEEQVTQMLASPRTVYLSVAATKPLARGRGLSTVLTWHGLEQARKEGYEICYTNWISPNLLASRFWPRFGFRDMAYRLAKKVDPSIAWTRDSTGT